MRIRPLLLSLIALATVLGPQAAAAAEPTVAFGARHGVALRSNGEVLTWGNNVGCQLGRRAGNNASSPGLVMHNAVEVAAASDHSLVLTADGKVYGWGTNAEGVLGTGDTYDKCEGPVLIESLAGKDIAHIATGYGFSIALSRSGELYCTGDNSVQQCAAARGSDRTRFLPVPLAEISGQVVAVSTGAFHTLALLKDGSLFAFGRGREGQLGHGVSTNGFGRVAGIGSVTAVTAGTWHSAARLADGTVRLWGANQKSQLCDGTTANRNTPAPVSGIPGTIAAVSAGGHSTLLVTTDGTVYACGDNQWGQLGIAGATTAPSPTRVPSLPAVKSAVVAMGPGAAVISADGCAIHIAGDNGDGLIGGATTGRSTGFINRPATSLCGPRATAPLGDIVNPAPSGGESNCWTTRVEEDASTNPRFAGLRQAMISAEGLLRKNMAFMSALEPVRLRTSLSAGPFPDSGARIHVKAVPERKRDGTRIWSKGCEVIPQVDRIGGAISQVSIFFNMDPLGSIAGTSGQPPKMTGEVAGYPEYNGWILLTKGGRLPWVPHTVSDKLDDELARRTKALDEYRKTTAQLKAPDEASLRSTVEMLRKNDPAGADKFLAEMRAQSDEIARQRREVIPATLAQLERAVADLHAYRTSLTQAQRSAPAVLGDPTGEGRRALERRVNELQQLTPQEQQQVEEWGREARDLERQARTSPGTAPALRAQANELGLKVRAARKRRLEVASPLIADLNAQYALTNLKPGTAEQAISVKADPTFFDKTTPNRVQLIMVSFSKDPDPAQGERRAWQQRVKDTFDFAALNALLD